MKKNDFNGKFIVLDGPDGCGKTTQAQLLITWLKGLGVDAVSFRDPGTTAAGEAIRNILLSRQFGDIDDAAEVMLYMAARIQLWHHQIKPALEADKCVVMDRWLSSTCVYQGYAGNFGIENVLSIAKLTLPRLWPDMTVILDLELSRSSLRLSGELDRMELKGSDYHNLVCQGYRDFVEMAKKNSWCKVEVSDAGKTIDEVHKDIVKIIEDN